MADVALSIRQLSVTDRSGRAILSDFSETFPTRGVTCVLGPSGAGKTTLLRCINRLVELTPELRVEGLIELDGVDVRSSEVDVDDLRRRIGIVFQQPVTFPGSIRRNVVFAAKRLGMVPRWDGAGTVEQCLRAAHLWDEVSDRLDADAATLSAGQRQRLALARTLAGQPEVVLMDEPTSALDHEATMHLEGTIRSIGSSRPVVLVTHDESQARRLGSRMVRLC